MPSMLDLICQALKLVEALEAKLGGTSLVWECLIKRGVITSVEQLNKQWKKKSLYLLGKSEIARKNYAEAIRS